MIVCVQCGTSNPEGAESCKFCRASLVAKTESAVLRGPSAETPAEPHSGPRKRSRIRVAAIILGYFAATCVLIVAILFVGLILHEQGIIKQADESSAAGMLRTMNTAAITYQSSYHNGFPPSQAAFGGETPGTCDAPGLFADSSFEMLGVNGGVQRSGYTITYTGGAALTSAAPGCTAPGVTAYVIHADPVSRGKTGQRSFFTDETGVIRSNQDGVATKDSAPIE